MAALPAFLRLGLTGWPLGHSLSPRLHAAALRALELPGEYRLYPAPPLPQGEEALAQLLGNLRRGELYGLNVTIPHKQSVLPLLDELAPAACAIGAANTLWMRAGRLVGENTDAPGFLADLKRLGFEAAPGERRALVLGAGGAARAVVYALAQAGWQVRVAARRVEQAAGLAELSERVAALLWQPAALVEEPCALLVNATPLGMFPQTDASPWPEELPFPAGVAVYDLVYNPAETRLVRAARAAGLRAANGLGMLVEQAALAFEVWTGRAVPRRALWEAVLQSPQPPLVRGA